MWIPTPVYERIPQFYFLVGLLFIANGLYMGFDFVLAFYYISFGMLVSLFGLGILAMRIKERQPRPVSAAAPEDHPHNAQAALVAEEQASETPAFAGSSN